MPRYGQPGHEHDEGCTARATFAWVDEMFAIAGALSHGDPDPHTLIAFATLSIARATGYALTADEYAQLLEQYKDTLGELIQRRYDREFAGIVTAPS